MSAIRIIDNVPHIFRYSREDEGYTWHQFWRNATRFEIMCKQEDIAGTAFERDWTAVRAELDQMPRDWVPKYERLCNLIAGQCQSTLERLAPTEGGRRWVTIEDYLRTPAYSLEMHVEPATGDAVARVVDGPTAQPAYEMRLFPMSTFDGLLDGLRRVTAEDVVVREHEVDYRQPPSKVIIPDTQAACLFKRTQRPVRSVETGEVSNPSIDGIVQILKGEAKDAGGVTIGPLAVVVTVADSQAHGVPVGELEMVAGILHT